MGAKSGIAWTDATWSTHTGCTHVSEGCQNCYMYREKRRYGQEPSEIVKCGKKTFNLPFKLKAGTKVFVCSWSDFFHKEADPWRDEAWDIIRKCPDLIFQICTKRIERVEAHLPKDWGDGWPQVWLAVTAENQKRWDERVPLLLNIPAKTYFVSVEPMLGPIDATAFDLEALDWVITGGESGPEAREMKLEWARSMKDQCKKFNTPYFMKQIGGWPNKLDKMSDFPDDLKIREFPK